METLGWNVQSCIARSDESSEYRTRVGVIWIGNRNQFEPITWSHVIIIVITNSRCNAIIIVIDYIVNVIIISDYFHDYTRCLIIYNGILCKRYGLVCKAKDNNITDLPVDIYTHGELSVYLFYEHERKMCWKTASDVTAIIRNINKHFILTRVVFTRLTPN